MCKRLLLLLLLILLLSVVVLIGRLEYDGGAFWGILGLIFFADVQVA